MLVQGAGGGVATAQYADPERELHKLDSSLRDSETRRDQLRRRADRTATEIGGLKRRPIMRLLFRSLVRGDETGVPGLEGLRFSFFRDRVGMRIRPDAATVRVNNQPVVGEATVRDRTWIGTGGRLYSFLFSAEQSGLDLASADD